MDATEDIISVLILPFKGYCQKDYHLRVIFNILALALFDPDWTPCLGYKGSAPYQFLQPRTGRARFLLSTETVALDA